MKNSLLLPNRYKQLGFILFTPIFLIGLYMMITGFEFSWLNAKVFSLLPQFSLGTKDANSRIFQVNLSKTIVGVLFIIVCLLIAFSKEKNEDEYIAKLRQNALLWAVLINYILLIIAFVLIYDVGFMNVMIYNMFTVLLLFIFRFHYLLHRSKKLSADEK